MAQVEGLEKVLSALQKRAGEVEKAVSVKVGYEGTDYGLIVHEDLEAFHQPPTQAKYLETPARLLKDELARIVRENLKRGLPLSQCLLLAGLRLQRESQAICPVDKGVLRNSAFTRLEQS